MEMDDLTFESKFLKRGTSKRPQFPSSMLRKPRLSSFLIDHVCKNLK